jgi:hypothetical protein
LTDNVCIEWSVATLPPHLAMPIGSRATIVGAPRRYDYRRDVADWLAETGVAVLADAHWMGYPTQDWPTDTWAYASVCRIVGRRVLVTTLQRTYWYAPEELTDSLR